MKRDRATTLITELLGRAVDGGGWPLDLVQAVYLFGSYARGAPEPGDVDIAVDIDRSGDEWRRHFIHSMSYGRDPYAVLRMALRGRGRAISLLFEREGHNDIPMTLVWRRGEALSVALDRVRSISVDPGAGRAERDAMLPCFEGMEDVLPRALRQEIVSLAGSAVLVGQVVLPDERVRIDWASESIEERWGATSPLYRAAHAVLAHLDARGVDLSAVHLHGRDMDPDVSLTPYFAGFGMRYLRAARMCLTEENGVEWIEVVRPTRRQPLRALVLRPGPEVRSSAWGRSPGSFFA